MVRAFGSYPNGRRFESVPRYYFIFKIMKTARILLFSLMIFLFSFRSVFSEDKKSSLEFFFKSDSQYQKVLVRKVLQTNRILIEGPDKLDEKVILIGLKNAVIEQRKEKVERDERGFVIPSEVSPFVPVEQEAFDFDKGLLEGKYVRLEFDVNKANQNADTLAYVFLLDNNFFVNAEIIRQGFADLQIRPPNTKYADKLREAYQEARKEKRGLQGQY